MLVRVVKPVGGEGVEGDEVQGMRAGFCCRVVELDAGALEDKSTQQLGVR